MIGVEAEVAVAKRAGGAGAGAGAGADAGDDLERHNWRSPGIDNTLEFQLK